jgi:hypothetical protein
MLKQAVTLTSLTITLALATSSPAAAQIAPVSRTVPITFNGVVTNDVTKTIQIRQSDGSFAPFVGQVPDYPYKVGDQVTISFNATVPTREFYKSPLYTGQQAADGIYRIGLSGNLFTSSPVGTTDGADVSGPARIDERPYALRGLTVVFDSNADSYSLELPSGSWLLGPLDVPSYIYDPATQTLRSSTTACFGPQCETAGLVYNGDAKGGTIGGGFGRGIQIGLSTEPTNIGIFDPIRISGGFNIPFFNGGGDPTPVPEPSMVILFGACAAAMMRRRRKRAV